MSGTGTSYYEPAPKRFVCDGDRWTGPAYSNNVSIIGSGNYTSRTAGFGVRATGLHEFAMPGSFTVEGFYLLTSNATNKVGADGNDRQPLFNEGHDGYSSGWGLRTEGGTHIFLALYKITNTVTGAQAALSVKGTEFTTGKWHHVAVVYNDEASPKTLTCFLDYEQKMQFEFGANEALPRSSDGLLHLAGAYANNANTTWFGGFDEFRVTRRALDPAKFLRYSNRGGVMLIVE